MRLLLVLAALLSLPGMAFGQATATLTVFDVTQYGATPNDAIDDTAAIQAAIDEAEGVGAPAKVMFPRGDYNCANLTLTGNNITITGYDAALVLNATLGTGDGASMLYITGNYCIVEGLEFDGNVAGAITGKNRCVQINGTNAGTGTGNKLYKLYCHDTYNDPANSSTADTIQIVNGKDNIVEQCYSLRAGWNGIRVSGDGNRVIGNIVENYLGRGIRFNAGESGWVTDNVVKTSINSGAALLTDPEDEQFGTWYCERNRVYLKSNRVHDVGGEGSNAVKVARTKHAVLRDNEIEIVADTYSTGTVAYDHTGGANERQLTLSGGTWPTWAKLPGRVFINDDWYALNTRVSDTVVTLTSGDNPGSDIAAGASYFAEQTYDNVGLRLEDGNDHVEIQGGRTDQILMTAGLMAGSISAHADNGSGKVRFTQTGHGWTAANDGKVVYVTGSDIEEYNTKHVFKYINANTWDSVDSGTPTNPMSIDYVSGTLGSAKAHGATDILTVRNVHFGRDLHTNITPMENIRARVFDIEGCTFDLRHSERLLDGGPPYLPFDPDNEGGNNTAIEWAMDDDAYDLLRVVNNEMIGAHAGANCRLITPETESTELFLAGKTIGYNNRVRNIGAGGSALLTLTTSNASRAQLFNTNGEISNEFRGTAAPTAGTWVVGQKVWDIAPAIYEPAGWLCTASGSPGTWKRMAPVNGGLLYASSEEEGNSGTAETDLMSYTLPAGLTDFVGDRMVISAVFNMNANAANKRVRFKWGATTIYDSGNHTYNSGGDLKLIVEAVVNASGTPVAHVTAIADGVGTDPFITETQGPYDVTFASTTVIKATGQSSDGDDDYVEQQSMAVRYDTSP